jgi:hypothetical protein
MARPSLALPDKESVLNRIAELKFSPMDMEELLGLIVLLDQIEALEETAVRVWCHDHVRGNIS